MRHFICVLVLIKYKLMKINFDKNFNTFEKKREDRKINPNIVSRLSISDNRMINERKKQMYSNARLINKNLC